MVFETMWHVIVWYSNLEVIDSPSVSSLSFHSGSEWVFIPCWVNVPAQNQCSCFRTQRNRIQTYVAMWNLTRKLYQERLISDMEVGIGLCWMSDSVPIEPEFPQGNGKVPALTHERSRINQYICHTVLVPGEKELSSERPPGEKW